MWNILCPQKKVNRKQVNTDSSVMSSRTVGLSFAVIESSAGKQMEGVGSGRGDCWENLLIEASTYKQSVIEKASWSPSAFLWYLFN